MTALQGAGDESAESKNGPGRGHSHGEHRGSFGALGVHGEIHSSKSMGKASQSIKADTCRSKPWVGPETASSQHSTPIGSMYDEYKEPLFAAPPLLSRMVDAGLLGRKSGRGFYDYTASA